MLVSTIAGAHEHWPSAYCFHQSHVGGKIETKFQATHLNKKKKTMIKGILNIIPVRYLTAIDCLCCLGAVQLSMYWKNLLAQSRKFF
jgi:hypothetical protein